MTNKTIDMLDPITLNDETRLVGRNGGENGQTGQFQYGEMAADFTAKVDQKLAEWENERSYDPSGDFTTGFTADARNQIFLYDGEWYRWDGGLPKTVPASSTPSGTGGFGSGAWLSVGDASLRNDLLYNPDDYKASLELQKTLGLESFKDAAIPIDNSLIKNITSKKITAFAIGYGESSSLSSDYNYTKLDGIGAFSTTPSQNHGWLAANNASNYIEVIMPFGVVIGDSIAEGHPNQHGRLHQSYPDPTFNDAIVNAYGTPAYALSKRTGFFWYNHGIGGETTTQVLDRFERDALGKTVIVGDGRPDSTLPNKPVWIWVNAGINDVSALTDTSVTKSNLLKMAILALKAGCKIGFNTIGPVNGHDATQRSMQDDINNFILTVLPKFGCYTFDFHSWFVDPSDPTKINPALDADGVHPNEVGYNNYVARLLSDCEIPIFFNGLTLESLGSSYSTNYREPTAIEFESESGLTGVYKMSGQFGYYNPNLTNLTSPLVKIYIRKADNVIDPSKHSGFSNIYSLIGCKQSPSEKEKSELYGASIIKSSGVWQIASDSISENVGVVGPTSVTSTGVFVEFETPVERPMVSVGSSTTPAILVATRQNSPLDKVVRVRFFDPATGNELDPTTIADNTSFNISAVGVVG